MQRMMYTLKKPMHELEKQYSEKIQRIKEALQKTEILEKNQCQDLDQLANLTGFMMAEILTYRKDEWYDVLYEMGDYLGRFIYIMDAYDDIEKDIKENQFNPFSSRKDDEHFDERVKVILEMMIARSADAFETLPILKYADILRNIIYSGVWAK